MLTQIELSKIVNRTGFRLWGRLPLPGESQCILGLIKWAADSHESTVSKQDLPWDQNPRTFQDRSIRGRTFTSSKIETNQCQLTGRDQNLWIHWSIQIGGATEMLNNPLRILPLKIKFNSKIDLTNNWPSKDLASKSTTTTMLTLRMLIINLSGIDQDLGNLNKVLSNLPQTSTISVKTQTSAWQILS